MLTVHQLTVGSLEENTYAVVNEAGQALLIDPGADAPKILDWIESKGWVPQAILLTHAHHDHIGAVDAVRDRYGIPLYMHPVESGFLNQPELNLSAYWGQPFTARPAEVLWEDLGDKEVAGFHFKVVFVPGHSPGHVAYIFAEDHFVLSGDTIFAQSIAVGPNGRSSLFNPKLQNFYNLLTQPLDFSWFQTSCWPSWMKPCPPKCLIHIDITQPND